MTLSEVAVRGLFGRFDHRVTLNPHEPITIMIAPNGFGKTTILRIIDALFTRRLRRLVGIPFREIIARFDDGYELRVAKTVVATDSAENLPSTLALTLYRGERLEQDFTLPRISADEFPYPISIIEEWIPTLDRVEPRLWQHIETGERFTLEDVVQTYGHEFPQNIEGNSGMPDWLATLLASVPIHFITAERLTIPAPGRPERYRRPYRRPSLPQRAVNAYSDHLRRRIQSTLAEYGSLSQSLDRTLLARLVEKPSQPSIETTTLRSELQAIEDKRRQLANAGLLKRNDAGLDVPSLDIEDVDEPRRGVLEMFIQDAQAKLRLFDDLLIRVQNLQRIANLLFLYKRVEVSATGIAVTDLDGSPLKLTMLSSGEQHELVLLYALLFQVAEGSLIMIDEPELSMHVEWQERFLGDMKAIAELSDCRVLIATHSPQIIDDRYDLTIELKGSE